MQNINKYSIGFFDGGKFAQISRELFGWLYLRINGSVTIRGILTCNSETLKFNYRPPKEVMQELESLRGKFKSLEFKGNGYLSYWSPVTKKYTEFPVSKNRFRKQF